MPTTAGPVILAVDDTPECARDLERDLEQRYGGDYRVLRTDSGQASLQQLEQLHARGEPVALILANQDLAGTSGTDLLGRAKSIVPDARRVLLIAPTDVEAAVKAIDEGKIQHYLPTPWDPPQQHLFPFLDDLLADWRASTPAAATGPAAESVRVIGDRWSPHTHTVREFLGRNLIPFRWLDPDTSEEARQLLASVAPAGGHPALPVVVFADGSFLADPDVATLAERVGLHTHAERRFYNLVIAGAGPAGLAAAVYGASEGLKTVVVEREAPGGQAGTSSRIENYLGFPTGLSGMSLAHRAVEQALKFGAEILTPQQLAAVRVDGQYRVLTLGDGSEISSRALLIATGVSYRKLEVPGADRLTGAGVYYGAATTEAPSCQDEDVFIVGGGNSAGQAALNFAQYARHVTILVRDGSLTETMSQYLIDQIEATPRIRVVTHAEVVGVEGEHHLERITIDCEGRRETIPANSLFIFIGAVPHTDWLGDLVQRDEFGYIRTGRDLERVDGHVPGWPLQRDPFLLETNIPGIFAAGDVRHGSIKRVASAVGEGAMAVAFTHQYLAET